METSRGSFSIEYIRGRQDSLTPIASILTILAPLIQYWRCSAGDGVVGMWVGGGELARERA